jgi:hypothetical protein
MVTAAGDGWMVHVRIFRSGREMARASNGPQLGWSRGWMCRMRVLSGAERKSKIAHGKSGARARFNRARLGTFTTHMHR